MFWSIEKHQFRTKNDNPKDNYNDKYCILASTTIGNNVLWPDSPRSL